MTELNASFLRLLGSIAHVEKDPRFKSENYEFKSGEDALKLTYPNFIMSVSSPTGKQPSPFFATQRNGDPRYPGTIRGITVMRNDNLPFGELFMRANASEGKLDRFTVLVHEGTYFMNHWLIFGDHQPKRLHIDIVGTKNVRWVFGGEVEDMWHHNDLYIRGDVEVTIRNIMIYQRRPVPAVALIKTGDGAVVNLIDVKIHAPEGTCLGPYSSTINLEKCFLTRSWTPFNLACNADVFFDKCQLNKILTRGKVLDSKLVMKNTLFDYLEGPAFSLRISEAHLENCTLEGNENYCFFFNRDLPNSYSIFMESRSKLTLLRTNFIMADTAINVANSGSEIVAKQCDFSKSINCALDCHLNASLSVEDSCFHGRFIMQLYQNPHGKVVFSNNQCDDPFVLKDSMSKDPEYDFSKFEILHMPEQKFFYEQQGDMQDLSGATKRMAQAVADGSIPYQNLGPTRAFEMVKSCAYCHTCEVYLNNGEKLKYCKKCKLTCYCNSDCQNKDWRDHKIFCGSVKKHNPNEKEEPLEIVEIDLTKYLPPLK